MGAQWASELGVAERSAVDLQWPCRRACIALLLGSSGDALLAIKHGNAHDTACCMSRQVGGAAQGDPRPRAESVRTSRHLLDLPELTAAKP